MKYFIIYICKFPFATCTFPHNAIFRDEIKPFIYKYKNSDAKKVEDSYDYYIYFNIYIYINKTIIDNR